MNRLLNAIRVRWLNAEIRRIDARIDETQHDVDAWPKTRGVWLLERTRLEMLRDRAMGRGDRVNYSFGGRVRQ